MNKKSLLFIFVFLIGLMSVNAYTQNTVFSRNCYQESANISNQTGIDGDCNLNYTGSYTQSGSWIQFQVTNDNDGDWSSFVQPNLSSSATESIIYNKPSRANSSIWSASVGNSGIINLTIPNDCYSYSSNNLNLKYVFNISFTPISSFYCYNSSWKLIGGSGGYAGSNVFREEANNWNIKEDKNITYYLTSNNNIIGSQSNITLNISKNLSQIYNIPILVYKGISYNNSTQINYSDYILFIQTITNSEIGNFSYFWNVSLTDYNIQLNFLTINNSQIINPPNYSFSSPNGVFGESSNIILNLTKGTNQSYSNADLVYNGVVYSNPTKTEFSGYTLFTHSVDNDVIGNFSYFWNISLVDYDNQFNFTTVNSSHIVAGSHGNLAFYDEITKSLLVRNITLEAIGSLLAENYSTATGYLNISNLSTGSYVFRFKSLPEYAERFYLYDISGDFNLSLYLINGSTQIALTVKDQNDNVLSGAVIKIQRYDIDSNAYTTREIVSTNVNGLAYFEGLLNSEYYRFVVEYPFGTQVLETSPDYLRSTSLTLRVNLEALVFTDYFAVLNAKGKVTFNNATNNFAFDYNGASVTQGCLYIYDDDISNTLLNTSCVAGSASIILINVANVSGKTYTAKGTVFINGEEHPLSVKSYTFPTTSANNLTIDNKKMFLLLTIFLIMVIGLLTLWNVTVFLMLTPLPLFVMSLIGLIPISRGVGVTIYLVAITLAILISKRS